MPQPARGRIGDNISRRGCEQGLYRPAQSLTRHCEKAKPSKQSKLRDVDSGLLRLLAMTVNHFATWY
jgi:hypothetical protein